MPDGATRQIWTSVDTPTSRLASEQGFEVNTSPQWTLACISVYQQALKPILGLRWDDVRPKCDNVGPSDKSSKTYPVFA